jgi:DNA polymerase family B
MKPLKNKCQYREMRYIIALDIETSSKGKLLDIGCYTEHTYNTFDGWKKFFIWLFEMIETREESVRIIAHNGFGFDFVNMLPWLLEHTDDLNLHPDDILIFSSETLVVGGVIKYNGYSIELFDTLRLFSAISLDNLAKDFLGVGKNEIPERYKSKMEVYKRIAPKKYYAYLKRDCEALYRIYEQFRTEINSIEKIGELGYSSGSTAFRAFRSYLGRIKPKLMIYSLPDEFIDAGEEAMRGGFTSYIGDGYESFGSSVGTFKGEYYDVWSYDVISMYPHAMMYTPIPTCEPEHTKKIKLTDDGDVWPGYYLVDYQQETGRMPIFKPLKVYKDDEPQWKGTALLSSEEVQWLRENGTVKVLEGIYYPEYEQPFRAFIDRMLKNRMLAKSLGQSAKAWAYKILVNSLYGKFAQRATKQIIAITGNRDWYYNELLAARKGEYTEFYNGSVYMYGTEVTTNDFSNRLIGAMVTARARLKLGLVMNTVHAVYGDTDSIYTQDQLDKRFVGNEVGQFELKHPTPEKMVCLGKKLYVYGEEKHAKGVPNKSVEIRDFYRMAMGEKVRIEYKTPTALKTALKNKVQYPNEFTEKHRDLHAFPSMRDKGLIHTKAKTLKTGDVYAFLLKYHLI